MIGDLIDSLSGADKDKKKQSNALDDALSTWQGLDTPEYNNIDYVAPEYAGDVLAQLMGPADDISVDPVEATTIQASTMGDSAFNDISSDPRLREAQLSALSELEGISEAGGMTAADEANMNRMISQVNQQDRGRREAIQQNMARRGMGGSGMELLAQMQNSQASTDRASQQGLDIQGMAQARALEAMMQSGQLAGGIRGQDFGEAAQKAAAQDAIAQFNAGQGHAANVANMNATNSMAQYNAGMDFNSQSANVGNDMAVNQFNTNTLNNTHTGNRDARQGVNNAQAAATNQSLTHNNYTIPNAQFNNASTKAGGVSGAQQAVAGFHGQQAAGKNDAFGKAVTGAATVAGGIYGGPAGATAANQAASAAVEDKDKQ